MRTDAGAGVSVLERVVAVDRAFERVERAVLSGAVLAMALLAIAGVASRNVLGQGLAFAEELQQVLLIWITFLGISHGVREGRHIRMSALCDALPPAARRGALAAICAATSALLALLAVWAASYTGSVRAAGSVTPALRLPWHAVYAAVPLGLGLGALQYAFAALRNLFSREPYLALRQPDVFREPEATI